MNEAPISAVGQEKRTRRSCGRATGRFATREELAAHIWAIRRHQIRPNLRAVASACGTTVDVVRAIVASEEGLARYLECGLTLGGCSEERP